MKEVVVDSHMVACDTCGSVVFESKQDLHELFHKQYAELSKLVKDLEDNRDRLGEFLNG